jgi:hypothetical protein
MNELDFNGRQVLVVGGSSGVSPFAAPAPAPPPIRPTKDRISKGSTISDSTSATRRRSKP